MNRIYYFIAAIYLLTTFWLPAQSYEAVNLSEMYRNNSQFEEGQFFQPIKINNNNQILGLIKDEDNPHQIQLSVGDIKEDEIIFSEFSAPVLPLRPIFFNDQGQVAGKSIDEKPQWVDDMQKMIRKKWWWVNPINHAWVLAHAPQAYSYSNKYKAPFFWDPKEGSEIVEIPFKTEIKRKRYAMKGLDEKGQILFAFKKPGTWAGQRRMAVWDGELFIRKHEKFSRVWGFNREGSVIGLKRLSRNQREKHGGARNVIRLTDIEDGISITFPNMMKLWEFRGFNEAKKALFTIKAKKGKRTGYLYLWDHEGYAGPINESPISRGYLRQSHLNNINHVVYMDKNDVYLWRGEEKEALSELMGDASLKIIRIMDFNDADDLLVLGKMPNEETSSYYLLKATEIAEPAEEIDLPVFIEPPEEIEEDLEEDEEEEEISDTEDIEKAVEEMEFLKEEPKDNSDAEDE